MASPDPSTEIFQAPPLGAASHSSAYASSMSSAAGACRPVDHMAASCRSEYSDPSSISLAPTLLKTLF